MRKQCNKEKGYNIVVIWECERWNLHQKTTCVKEHLRESFPHKRPLGEGRLLEQKRSAKLFGSVQCDIEVPEELKKKFANFAPIFTNTKVGRHDIGLMIKDYAEKEVLVCQPRKMLISSFSSKWKSHFSSAPILFKLGTSMQKNLSLRGICSN